MATQIFINLPTLDLKKSTDFFVKLGYTLNTKYSDDKASCIIVSTEIFLMLLTHETFKGFTPRNINDAHKYTEVLTGISVSSKDQVNNIVEKALSLGATEIGITLDYGFMVQRSFSDLDGHIWEYIYIDETIAPQ
jgi:uncharacterized protein